MKNLFLTILLIVILFLIFRFYKKFKVHTFYAVVINYYVCILTGALFLNKFPDQSNLPDSSTWVHLGILTGSLFVPCFYLMGLTVEKVSVSVSTVANKMSLVIPVIFSLLYLQKGPDDFSLINITGVLFALAAIVLTSVKARESASASSTPAAGKFARFILPLSIFLLGGIIDTLINYSNYVYLQGEAQAIFPLVMFATAAVTGTAAMIFHLIISGRYPRWKDLAGGIILGIPNYFSLYFLLKTLSDFNNDGSVVYPVVNIGVIVIAALAAVVLFREKLSVLNLCGIGLATVSLIMIFWK